MLLEAEAGQANASEVSVIDQRYHADMEPLRRGRAAGTDQRTGHHCDRAVSSVDLDRAWRPTYRARVAGVTNPKTRHTA
jgi:hypothetical protein